MSRPALLWLALCCSTLALARPTAAAPAAPAITLHVQAGLDGFARVGHELPVIVDVTNTGPAVTADLVTHDLEPPRRALGTPTQPYETSYIYSVSLPTDAQKRVVLHVPVLGLAQQAVVELRSGGTTLATASTPVTVLGDQQVLVGVVRDTPAPVPTLGQVSVPYPSGNGNAPLFVAALGLADLPVRPEEISSMDALILAGTSTRLLTPQQTEALEGWVSRGGALVLMGGAGWDRVAEGLPSDLMPVAGTRLATMTGFAPLAAVVGVFWTASQPALVTSGAPRGSVTIAQQDGVPLLVLHPYGAGSVIFSAADLTAPPFKDWTDGGRLWQRLLVLALPADRLLERPRAMPGVNSDFGLSFALNNVPAPRPPALVLLAWLLLLYVALFAPLNYLLLRRLGHRGLIWLTMPALALGFSALTFGIAFRARGSPVVINTITVTEVPAGAQSGELLTYSSFFAPPDQEYHVQLDGAGSIMDLATPAIRRAPFTAGSAPPVPLALQISQDAPRLELARTSQWLTRAVKTERWLDGTPIVQSHLSVSGAGVDGVIVNESGKPLSDCAMASAWATERLGTIGTGASVSVTLPRRGDAATPSLSQLYTSSGSVSSLPADQVRRLQLKQQILNALWPSYGALGEVPLPLGPVVLLCWTDPAGPAPLVDGHRVPQAGLGLLAQGLVLDTTHAAVVPPDVLPVHALETANVVAVAVNSTALGNGSLTVAALLPADPSDVQTVTLAVTTPGSQSTAGLTISAYNWRTGSFDPLVLTVVTLTAPTPSNPVLKAGGVRVVSGEVDATLGPGDLSAYRAADGTIHFRLSRQGPGGLTLGSITYGFTRGGPS